MRTAAALTLTLALTLAGCATQEPEVEPTTYGPVSDHLIDATSDCVAGDRAACNRAYAMAAAGDQGGEWEDIALRCGDPDADPATPDPSDPLWLPCEVTG